MSAYGRTLTGMVVLAVAVATLGSCSKDGVTGPQAGGVGGAPVATEPSSPAAPTAPAGPTVAVTGGVQASVVVDPFEGGEQVLRVWVEGKDVALGSYQGRLRFDPAVLGLAAVVPRGGPLPASEFHVVNAGGAERSGLRGSRRAALEGRRW